MLRIPQRLCQTVAGAFTMCEIDTPEVAVFAKLPTEVLAPSFSRVSHQLPPWLEYCSSLFPIVFCLIKSLVFSPSKLKSSSPRSHSSILSGPPVQLLGSFSIICASDATFEPGLRTWVSRRLCRLVSSDWITPLLPCVMDSFFHSGWPSPIPLGTSRSLANYRLHSWKPHLRLKTNLPLSDVFFGYLQSPRP